MQQLSLHISTIASEFEKKIKELNNTFRSFHEATFYKIMESNDGTYLIPECVKSRIRTQIQDLYLYILKNYSKIPENKRIEIKYYDPLHGDYQEILISTAIRSVFAFYLIALEDLELVTDPNAVKFGNYVVDNYLIVVD